MSRLRNALGVAAAAVPLLAGTLLAPPTASATPPAASYVISVGTPVSFNYPTDTPAFPYLDKDGTFYFQQSASLYGKSQSRYWDFYTGTDLDTATRSSTISNSVNPTNSNDKNNDTTWRCNNSPTGLTATYAPSTSSYSQKNFCDLSGVWVDPDTGYWYGLVHNEFTPQPFGDGLHFDAIDYAVSTDQGMTWTIKDHVITSPYSTNRGDTTAFPNQTYYYGDGDQRLFVDTASGYFYVFYGSRVIDKTGGWKAFYEHAARAPISAKMAPSSWQKWYNGAWSEPGQGGRESNMVPVDSSSTTGYTPAANEYNPANTGTSDQQIAAGTMPPTSPLFVMDITYDAYLGLYIGEPQAVDQSGNSPQYYYATDDLSTQRWYPIGDSGSYHTASWYRWFLDGANRTSSGIVGKTFRTYCSFGCSNHSSGEYVPVTVDSSAPAPGPVDLSNSYVITNGSGRVLAQASAGSSATTSVAGATGSNLESWIFTADGDGSYLITNAATGQALGVDSSATANRVWGAKPTVTAIGPGGPTVGQQWFLIANVSSSGATTGTFRFVNRYSGLVLGMDSDSTRLTETVPNRDWTDTSGSPVGGGRTADEQTLTLTAAGSAPETVTVNSPGAQTGTVGTAVSLQIGSTDSQGKALTYSATGLPAGLSINVTTGLISGIPTTAATSTTTVTATSGTAGGSVSFIWTVNPATPNLSGTHTVSLSGKALDDPNWSRSTGVQLDTWVLNGGQNQSWTFTQQADGSYTIVNAYSKLCADDYGGFTTAGTKVIQWTCTVGSNQHWTVARLANGAYTITNVKSGLLLTTSSTADGGLVTQQPDTSSSFQQWTIS